MTNDEDPFLVLYSDGYDGVGVVGSDTAQIQLDSLRKELSSDVAECTGTILPAVVEGDIEQLENLLNVSPHLVNATCENCDVTPLGAAIMLRQPVIVVFLLSKGAEANLETDCSDPPLFIAAELGYLEIVEILVDAGAILKTRNIKGLTALQRAALAGHVEVVDLLSAKGAPYTIHSAAACGDIEELEMLIASDPVIVNSTNERAYSTPLLWAVLRDQSGSVKTLLEHGANVEARDIEGRVPLHYAKSKPVAQILLSHGAKPNTRSTNKVAPLHDAAGDGEDDVVENLLSAGAKVNATDVLRSTPLHFAVMYDHLNTVRLLIENGADVNAKQYEGQTPLHYAAARSSQKELISLLVKEGADLDARDRKERRPIDLAIERGNEETANILKEFEATQRPIH